MNKFTAALNVIGLSQEDAHITLCFCDAEKAGKFRTSDQEGIATVRAIEYWENINATVLIVDCPLAQKRHEYYQSLGYRYDGFTFNPHITVGEGDLTQDCQHLIGKILNVGEEYARTY